MNILNTKYISEATSIKSLPINKDKACQDTVKQEELINLLTTLQHQAKSLTESPHKLVLEHAIQVCQSFLNNLLEIDWHKNLYEQAQFKNESLNEQLKLVLKLLNIVNIPSADYPNAITQEHPDEFKVFRKAWLNLDDWLKKSLPKTMNYEQPETANDKPGDGEFSLSSTDDCTNTLEVCFLGTFRVCREGKLIDCLSKSRAKQLLKYLILNRTKSIPKEVLMDRFWPDHDENSARNNLNVAVYCLRQALKHEQSNCVHVLFQDGCYYLNPKLQLWVDTEVFEQHVKMAERFETQGKMPEAIREYSLAEALYKGEFLAEDLYEDWSLELREHYKGLYVKLLGKLSEYYYQERLLDACIAVNRKITSVEVGDEHAHRRLMECFALLNQRHLALRQFQLCNDILAKEFELKPSQETLALYRYIKAQGLSEKAPNEWRGNLKQA